MIPMPTPTLSNPFHSMVRGASRPLGRGSIAVALVMPALLVPGLAARGNQSGAPPQHLPIEARWCPAGRSSPKAGCVALEVPRTWHQYTLGLQLRPPLPAGRGMWFAYRPARVARFWMHRTPQPLDMVFVRNGRVIAIETAAAPCMRLPCLSYGPNEPVDGVLELAAGKASRLDLRVGSPLRVELLRSFGPTAPAPD